MRAPSGLNATLHTESVWPVSGAPIGAPVPASHIRTVVSPPPETIRAPSGLNATPVHRAGVAGQRGAAPRSAAGARVPHPHRGVGAAGNDPAPSGLDAHRAPGVAGQRGADGLPVPASHSRTVGRRRRRRCGPVRAQCHTPHRAGVAGQRRPRAAGRCPRPTAAPCCRRCRKRCGPVGAERPGAARWRRIALRQWSAAPPIGAPVAGVPHPHRVVVG